MTQTRQQTIVEELQGTAGEIIRQLKKLIREGSARRLIVKNRDGKILLQSNLALGVAGTAFVTATAPILSAVSMFLLFMNDVSVIVEKESGSGDEYEIEADVIEIEDEEDEVDESRSDPSDESGASASGQPDPSDGSDRSTSDKSASEDEK